VSTIAFMYFTYFVIMLLRMGLIFLYYYCVPQHLQPLRIRTHKPLTWDEWYASFIRCARFLSLARLLTGDLTVMDSTALMTLVDQWHPETHTFHLPCGETTVMLQDVAMILGLPIDNTPVCETVSPGGWRDSVSAAIDLRPPNVPTDQKDRKTTGVHSRWLIAHFDTCPEGAKDAVVQRYARSYLWHMDDE
jgi:hypothetical protein